MSESRGRWCQVLFSCADGRGGQGGGKLDCVCHTRWPAREEEGSGLGGVTRGGQFACMSDAQSQRDALVLLSHPKVVRD